MQKEAKARILINDLLRRSGWRFFDDETGAANIALEAHVKIKKKTLDNLGDDFENTADGYVDYLLLDDHGFPIAVLEAKSEKFDPLVGKEQARKYAHSQNVRFVILAKAFGEIDQFKTKDELLEEELAKFVSIHRPDAMHMPVIRQFFKAYVTDGGVRAIVDSREFGQLADNPKVSLADVRATR